MSQTFCSQFLDSFTIPQSIGSGAESAKPSAPDSPVIANLTSMTSPPFSPLTE